jgi:hypothetical protein
MSSTDTGAEENVRYVGYDTTTGRIVHTHAQFSVAENRYVEVPPDQLKAAFAADESITARLSGGDADHLDYLKAATSEPLGSLMVDTANHRLVARPRLALSADRTELAGDGQDSVELAITVTGADGQVIEGAGGSVKVETTRGKLSARGGVLDLAAGRGTVTLTSANETVSQVVVRVSAPGQPYVPAELDLEFT